MSCFYMYVTKETVFLYCSESLTATAELYTGFIDYPTWPAHTKPCKDKFYYCFCWNPVFVWLGTAI